MVLVDILTRVTSAQSGRALDRLDRRPDFGLERAAETSPFSPAAQVTLGERLESLNAQKMVVEGLMSRVEAEAGGMAPDLLAAGRADFEAQAAALGPDTSPEVTAGRLVDGITGYIFEAWKAAHPDTTREALVTFQQQVMSGFEKGLQDAKDILTGLRSLTPEVAESIDRAADLARGQLKEFFRNTLRETDGRQDFLLSVSRAN